MSESLRVLHLVPALFGSSGVLGGAERYALELARHMAEVTPTTLLAFGESDFCETRGRLEVRVARAVWQVRGQRHNPWAWTALGEVEQADVVHCHQQHIFASSMAALYARMKGKRVFVSDLGGGGWDISGYLSTDSWYHGHLHISRYSRKVAGHDDYAWAHVIYGGVDTQHFTPAASPQRAEHVLYVGRLLPHKGVNYLIEALPDGMTLHLAGQPYDPRYAADLERLAEGKNVLFLRDCDDRALVAEYRAACCVVLPSVYRTMYGSETKVPELLGQTLLEGMACGIPAICTDVASMPEVVVDGVTGFVVAPNDPHALQEKLAWLRSHPAEAKAMGTRARQHVLDRFTWPVVVERCMNIYRGRQEAPSDQTLN